MSLLVPAPRPGHNRAPAPPMSALHSSWRSGGIVASALLLALVAEGAEAPPIDRRALVGRHHPVLHRLDPESPLSVGNGELAFTADVTGLQTFAEAYEATIPLGTLSQWGWHTWPNAEGWSIERFRFTEYPSQGGRAVGYADIPGDRRTPEVAWLRANPHRLHLGRIGFRLAMADGRPARAEDLEDVEQTLDLWDGVLRSRFRLEGGEEVAVETVCHPRLDLVAVRVASPLVGRGRIGVRLRFPYGTGDTAAADWGRPEAHRTVLARTGPDRATLRRTLDADAYHVSTRWAPAASIEETVPHDFLVAPAKGTDVFDFAVHFSREPPRGAPPSFEETRTAAREHWNRFWRTGGALDLSGSLDPRWRELERRIVLSQYLTAIQCAGRYPPQETGLTFNSWYGKFHLEMHWWHAAHFALWGRADLLERSIGWYQHILPRARELARRQGYHGARWPKQVGPEGIESPSAVSVFLIWQQPHPIYHAELLYRAQPGGDALQRYADLVFESAAFMASYAAWDAQTRRYVLGPPLIPAQETYGPMRERVVNPTFELAYWAWGLATAQIWRERLGLRREDVWDRVIANLARPAVRDGIYAAIDVPPYTERTDHPSMLAALGFLPKTPLVDADVMRRTLADVRRQWNWETTWGWDYPMMAMTAARVGEPGAAVEALLMDVPKNRYLANGHNFQTERLPLYLPGNGGLLYAVALMAAGWEGSSGDAPGFPDDGRWRVRAEGIGRAI